MQARAAGALALVAAMTLAGCATDVHVESARATWMEPGLWTALPENGTLGGLEFRHRWSIGVPVDGSAFADRWGADNVSVQFVEWTGSEGELDREGAVPITLSFGDTVWLAWCSGAVGDPTVRQVFVGFLENLTEASRDRIEASADTFVAEKVSTGGCTGVGGNGYRAEIDVFAPSALDVHIDSLIGRGYGESSVEDGVQFRRGDEVWTYDLDLGSKGTTVPWNGTSVAFSVDARDRAAIDFPEDARSVAAADAMAVARSVLADLGVGDPVLRAWTFREYRVY